MLLAPLLKLMRHGMFPQALRRLAAAFVKTHLDKGISAAAMATLTALQDLVHGLVPVMVGAAFSSTMTDLRQQLQQSGLLAALPGILSTAAQEVSKLTADPAQLAAPGTVGTESNRAPHSVAQYTLDLLDLLPLLEHLLGEKSLLHKPLSSSVESTVRLAAAAVELMCGYLHHAAGDHQLPQLQQQRSEEDTRVVMMALLQSTQHTAHLVAQAMESELQQITASLTVTMVAPSSSACKGALVQERQASHQLIQQLLLSPHWRRVSGFLLVAHWYALQRAEQQSAPTPAGDSIKPSCSNTSSGSSQGKGTLTPGMSEKDAEAYNRAAAFAATWQDELPATHKQLLQSLGCSSKGVLWAAGLQAAQSPNPGQHLSGVLCDIAAASTSATKWAHERSSHQGQATCDTQACAVAERRRTDAATDVLLASVMLRCAAHLVTGDASHTQHESYYKLCTAAAEMAKAAWSMSNYNIAKLFSASLAAPGRSLTGVMSAAQGFATAEGEQVFFLQHVLSALLASLRKTTTANLAHDMQKEVAVAAGQHASSNSSTAVSNGKGGRSGSSRNSNSTTSGGGSSSLSVTQATQAVTDSISALIAAACFATARLSTHYGRLPAGSTRGVDGDAAAASAAVGAQKILPTPVGVHACLQDCVRLAATTDHLRLQLLPSVQSITIMCTPHTGTGIAVNRFLCGLATPAGSAQQQQLFGVMCSLLKSVQMPATTLPRPQSGVQQREDVSTQYNTMMVVATVAAAALDLQPQVVASQAAGRPASGHAAAHSSGSSTQTQQAASSGLADAKVLLAAAAAPRAINKGSDDSSETLSMVPWLVLLGRSCLILAGPLYFSSFVKEAASGARVTTLRYGGLVKEVVDTFHLTWLPRLQLWLESGSTSAHLAAAGLNLTGLLQALEDTLTVLDAMVLLPDNTVEAASADLARQKLHVLGVCLSSLPLSWGCSSPVCTNLQGPTEAGIVQGKGHVCKGCHVARYCDKACQALHWKHHKPVCKAITAAAAKS